MNTADGNGMPDVMRKSQQDRRLIESQLAALDAGPPKRRREFRALEYVCRACGDVILEVMKTWPYEVVLTRGLGEHPRRPVLAADATMAARVADMGEQGEPIRRGGQQVWPLRPTGDATESSITTSCSCRSGQIAMSAIRADIAAGTKKRAI